jgi:hypothetical protein
VRAWPPLQASLLLQLQKVGAAATPAAARLLQCAAGLPAPPAVLWAWAATWCAPAKGRCALRAPLPAADGLWCSCCREGLVGLGQLCAPWPAVLVLPAVVCVPAAVVAAPECAAPAVLSLVPVLDRPCVVFAPLVVSAAALAAVAAVGAVRHLFAGPAAAAAAAAAGLADPAAVAAEH